MIKVNSASVQLELIFGVYEDITAFASDHKSGSRSERLWFGPYIIHFCQYLPLQERKKHYVLSTSCLQTVYAMAG